MKYFFVLLSLLLVSANISAQPLLKNNSTAASGGNTYAIVIGISSYQDPGIRQLNYSNRDATVFAEFLMSASGGSVPKQNIKLLTDSMATTGEVDKAMRWLVDNCQQNDKVFFYFSGHGEVENITSNKNGYLICYNTPSVAFKYMSLSIDYLNDIVNTISVQTKAKVVVITDACHSGTMNGDKFKGNLFVGEQLMLKKENEIRMASCKPDQLSNEKEDWGGGRGVFSYYLVNALQGGLADANHDGVVSLGELKTYMETSMAKDAVLKSDGDVQTPVINGNADFKLSTVVESETKKIKAEINKDSIAEVMVTMSAQTGSNEGMDLTPPDYFFTMLKKQNLEALTDSAKLNMFSSDKIAFALIKEIKKDSLSAGAKNKLSELETSLKNNKETLSRFNLDLASAFLDVGQNVIADYLRGDAAEMERRRYYNSQNNGYDVYTRMFSIALKLSKDNKFYSTKAAVFLHYFSGLVIRLKIPLTENQAPLIEAAFIEQKKALELEENVAYIYNELGVLYQYKNKYDEAEKYFIKATKISPNWAIPLSNLSGVYILKAAYNKALAYVDKADSLQKDLQSVIVNRGYINEKKGNQLFAEEDYHHAIEINSRHFAPFERLGYVNMNMANYAVADSFFYEADLRKKGYHFKGNDVGYKPDIESVFPLDMLYCAVDSSILEAKDIFAFFTWGIQEYRDKKYSNAVRILRKVVTMDKTNPLVYHYLGKIYYDQHKWEEAEVMFKLALVNSIDTMHFGLYFDSVVNSKKYKYDHGCFEEFFKKSYYDQVEDYYFAGTLYENWKHFEEAEKYFNMIITLSYPDVDGFVKFNYNEIKVAYVKLWRLLENQGRFNEAEDIIKDYGSIFAKQSDEELSEFYKRMMERFPDNGDWPYKLGNLLYNHASENTRIVYLDSIMHFPFQNKELFIDFDIYEKLGSSNALTLFDKSETGSSIKVILETAWGKLYVKNGHYTVPGTGDTITCAGAIYLPRKDGITYLQRAAELLSEREALADIHFKIGNIYLWAGSKKQAYPYFEKSLSIIPDNANARLTLIDIYKAVYKNRAALNQLNYLNDSSQINLEKRLLLAQFNIKAGEFDKANESLNKAENYTPYTVFEINNLRGLSNMLADKPKQAIAYYLKSVNAQDHNPWFNNYSLARLYAKTGNSTQAWRYLQLAVKAGFNYSFVLQNDSFLKNLQKTTKWEAFISSISMKKYRFYSGVK